MVVRLYAYLTSSSAAKVKSKKGGPFLKKVLI